MCSRRSGAADVNLSAVAAKLLALAIQALAESELTAITVNSLEPVAMSCKDAGNRFNAVHLHLPFEIVLCLAGLADRCHLLLTARRAVQHSRCLTLIHLWQLDAVHATGSACASNGNNTRIAAASGN